MNQRPVSEKPDGQSPAATTPRIVLTTFAFLNVRPDRPDDYFLHPMADYVNRVSSLRGSAHLLIYTNSPANPAFAALPFGEVRSIEPERLMAEIWELPNALDLYSSLIQRNPTHCNSYQARFPRLIAVYLAKVAAIRRALETGARACFWFDSGHWVSYQCAHQYDRYSSALQDRVTPSGLADRLLDAADRYGVIGCKALPGKTRFHMPLEWMYEYLHELDDPPNQHHPLCSAVFWLVHARAMETFVERFRYWWQRLIRDGKAGIEENALTLSLWERRWHSLSYANWVDVLCGAQFP